MLTGLPPPQKAQSKAERREGACNRAAEAQRRPFAERRAKGAGGAFALQAEAELSGLWPDEAALGSALAKSA